jgi:hypothetical protein
MKKKKKETLAVWFHYFVLSVAIQSIALENEWINNRRIKGRRRLRNEEALEKNPTRPGF